MSDFKVIDANGEQLVKDDRVVMDSGDERINASLGLPAYGTITSILLGWL